jgi:hypothetical protein
MKEGIMCKGKGIAFISFLAMFCFFMAAPAVAQQKKPVSLATASIGGAYYPVGQAMANVINKYVPTISMTPEVTNGGVENCRLVGDGNTDFGITNANLAYFAFHGQKPFAKKIDNLVALGTLHPSVFQIVALERSNIKTFQDLKGKRVAIGPAGGGTMAHLQVIFEEYGMSLSDIKASYLPYTDGFSQLRDGNVDAALALGGYPTAAITETATTHKIRMIALHADKFQSLMKKYPYYSKTMIPKEIYKLEEDAACLSVHNIFFTKKSMDEKLAYEVTKALYDHLDELMAINATTRQIDKKGLSQVPIPLHPGAKRYFDQKK